MSYLVVHCIADVSSGHGRLNMALHLTICYLDQNIGSCPIRAAKGSSFRKASQPCPKAKEYFQGQRISLVTLIFLQCS